MHHGGPGPYNNIRDILGGFVGLQLVDITQQDADEFRERGSFVCLMFSNGCTLTFPIGDAGFDVHEEEG